MLSDNFSQVTIASSHNLKIMLYEISKGLFIPARKVVKARIYEKDGGYKVAITMDTVNKEESTVFSDQMVNYEGATALIKSLSTAMEV